MKITFSTYLTLLRLIGAPIIIPFCIVNFVPQNNCSINLLIAALFLFFGLTDFLDGFFARKYGQETKLGAALDHIADKFLIFSALVALLAAGKISYVLVIVLIGREFFMMSLREIALENHVKIKVSPWGKLKTVIHIMFITWLIMSPMQSADSDIFNTIQVVLLAASVIISWGSAFDYVGKLYSQFKK
jgi:CDP-diacylglycerol--glycerol-3-phosphate 3-phosphatidyltransferase